MPLEARKGSRVIAVMILGIRWRQVVNVKPQLLYPWKEQEAECFPGPIWTGMERIKFLASTGIGVLNHPCWIMLLYQLLYPGPQPHCY